jgi:hypothetical protein
MHQSLQGATFHSEHVVPRAKGGIDDVANLALACPRCNLRKSDRTSAPDPRSRADVPIFNPRQDEWREHFRWNGVRLVGRTAVGRATITALDLNHPRRLRIRKAETYFGLFPVLD